MDCLQLCDACHWVPTTAQSNMLSSVSVTPDKLQLLLSVLECVQECEAVS